MESLLWDERVHRGGTKAYDEGVEICRRAASISVCLREFRARVVLFLLRRRHIDISGIALASRHCEVYEQSGTGAMVEVPWII
jgi:hypothetical protein